ncbi:eRF1 methyltransferase catalytic subunit [Lachnellula occidentalis]|uniref:ERF1 methyltransferase catalytic subunit n=1 Tax=Lachnellula occidentalis TaxID=215460 RepID=A0A8H8UHY3_9HELO|nr:eRF1 methyltransferase catalytic subunit [Lachnellula occidentalis]
MYSSPSNRISRGRCFLCDRSSLLYNGIGGKRANGAGLKAFDVPADVGVAISSLVLSVFRKRGSKFVASNCNDDDVDKPRSSSRGKSSALHRLANLAYLPSQKNPNLMPKTEIDHMLPTPSTSHVEFERVYEPAEDSYLLLDTLSSESEKAFLQHRFNNASTESSPSPLVVEIGTGSGVVLSFIDAHAEIIFGRSDVLTAGVDVNIHACKATIQTVRVAETEQVTQSKSHGLYLGNMVGDLATALRIGEVDVLVFNPPYVPTPDLPTVLPKETRDSFEADSHLLSLSYAGGEDGMEVTNRLLDSLPQILGENGCAYVLLCAQNKPELVKDQIWKWGDGWTAETVGNSGKKGGWEKLQIVRIWRISPGSAI